MQNPLNGILSRLIKLIFKHPKFVQFYSCLYNIFNTRNDQNRLSYNRALFLISLIEYKTYFAVQFPLYYTRHVVRYVLKTRIAP